ncbi:MAG: hypothetical protein ACRCT8_05140 [Lacipirellulaceae bacterium]
MARTERALSRALVGLCAASMIGAAAAGEATSDWRKSLPAGWLAVVAAESPTALDGRTGELLAPWGRKFVGVKGALAALAPGLALAEREVVIGVALPESGEAPKPFALLPVEDGAAAIRALGGDPTARGGLATIGSYEVALRQLDGWLAIEVAGGDLLEWGEGEAPDEGSGLLTLHVAGQGLRWLDGLLCDAPILRKGPLRWPTSIAEALRQASRIAPLMRELAARVDSLAIFVRRAEEGTPEGDLIVDVTLTPRGAPAIDEGDQQRDTPRRHVPPQNLPAGLIAELRSGPPPELLSRLWLAAAECQPDEVEAERYDPKAYAAYAERVIALASKLTVARVELHEPRAGDPVVANQVARVEGIPDFDLAVEVRGVAKRWNAVLPASHAGAPLTIECGPLGRSENRRGLRMKVDALVALAGPGARAGGPATEGLAELLAKFYGPDGVATIDVVEERPGAWLVSSLPEGREATIRDPSGPTDGGGGAIDVARYVAWRQRIDDIGHEQSVGRTVRPPMAPSPPATLRWETPTADRLRLELRVPRATHGALAARMTAAKVPVPAKD